MYKCRMHSEFYVFTSQPIHSVIVFLEKKKKQNRKNLLHFWLATFSMELSTKEAIFKHDLIDCVAKVWQQTGWKWCDFIIYESLSLYVSFDSINNDRTTAHFLLPLYICIHHTHFPFVSVIVAVVVVEHAILLILFNGTHSVILSRHFRTCFCVDYHVF